MVSLMTRRLACPGWGLGSGG